MTLSYPIAETGLKALTDPKGHARTRSMARAEAGQSVIFETDWLRPSTEELAKLQPEINAAIATGSVQLYEGATGGPVVAVSYWKVSAMPDLPEVRIKAGESKRPREDHADDLYFRKGRTKVSKKSETDPNQMDLFGPGSSE